MEVKRAMKRLVRRGMIFVEGERYFFKECGDSSFVVLVAKNENGDLNVCDEKGQMLGVARLMKKEMIKARKVAMIAAFYRAISAYGIPLTVMSDNGPTF